MLVIIDLVLQQQLAQNYEQYILFSISLSISTSDNQFGNKTQHVLQLTASPWTTEESTSERWQFGALTNRKATSNNRAPSTCSLYYY